MPDRFRGLYGIVLLASWMLSATISAYAQVPVRQWDKTIGGAALDGFSAMVATSDGGYLLAGSSSSGMGGDKTEASRGLSDYWIVKIAADGTKQWDKRYGGSERESLRSVIGTADGGFLLGGNSYSGISGDKSEESRGSGWIGGDYWIVKIDSDGTKQWDKTFGGPDTEFLTSLIPTTDGGYLLTGSSNSGVGGDKSEAGIAESDFWIVKITNTGIKQWDKTLGGSGWEDFAAVIQTTDGGYLLGGSSSSDSSGDKSESRRGPATNQVIEPYDFWLVKIDTNGTKQWDKTYGGNFWDVLSTLVSTPDGGYLLGGSSSSGIGYEKSAAKKGLNEYDTDYWVVKITSNGTKQWDKTYGGLASDDMSTIIPAPNNGYLLIGSSYSSNSDEKSEEGRGDSDAWLIKITGDGSKQWDKTFGGTGYDLFSTAIPTADGGYLLGGSSGSGVGYDKSEANRGDWDFWLVKTSPDVVPTSGVFRINAGGPAFLTSESRLFMADTYATGGFPAPSVTGEVADTPQDALYLDGRQGGDFKYTIPTGNGNFTVILHFNETYYGNLTAGGIGSRKFKVSMEGVRRLSEYDIFAKAGGAMKAITETFTVQVADSVLTLHFVRGSKGYAVVSAIEVIPATMAHRVTKVEVKESVHLVSSYPNPVQDRLWVKLDYPATEVLATQITDVAGRVQVRNGHRFSTNEQVLEFSLRSLKPGVYVLKVETSHGTQTRRFIKQ